MPDFSPAIPSTLTPLITLPVPGTRLPTSATGRNSLGFAGSIARWFAALHESVPVPVRHASA